MFDETNENQKVTGEQDTAGNQAEEISRNEQEVNAENTAEAVNPYMAQNASESQAAPRINTTEAQNIPISPIPQEPVKKSSNKVIIGVIVGIIVLLIVVLVLIFSGLFTNDKVKVLDALKTTFAESGDYIKEAYALEQYEGMFEDENYTFDAAVDTSYYGMGVDMTIEKNENVYGTYASINMDGSALLDMQLYIDEGEMVLAFPEVLDYIFTVDRTTMADDIQNMVEIGGIDQETADSLVAMNEGTEEEAVSEEAYEKLKEDFLKALADFYEECDMKKGDSKTLSVNGEDVSCKGYVLVITSENTANFADNLKTVLQDNKEAFASATHFYESAGMDSPYDIDEMCDQLDEFAAELREEGKELLIEFYLYNDRVAQIYTENEDGSYLEWNIEGGNFPLENTSLVAEDLLEIKRTGSDEDGEYYAKYEITDEYGDTSVLEVSYEKDNGDFYLEATGEYGDSVFLDGSIEKKNDTTVEIGIDSLEIDEEAILSADITIESTCGEIERPSGEEKELFLMSEDELNEALMDIIFALY